MQTFILLIIPKSFIFFLLTIFKSSLMMSAECLNLAARLGVRCLYNKLEHDLLESTQS